jgi:competence protein ComEC
VGWSLACLAALALLAHGPRRWRLGAALGGTLAALLMAFGQRTTPCPCPCVRVAFLDVGQGDACLVTFPNRESVLIDGGPRRAGWDSGLRTVAPALDALGVRRLRLALASHSDMDHLGGLLSLARLGRADRWLIPPRAAGGEWGALDSTLRRRRHAALEVRAGWSWSPEGCPDTLRVLWPDSAALRSGLSENDLCLVLEVAAPEGRVLLVGDLGVVGEARLEAGSPGVRRCEILKVGHHGSGGSSSEKFVELAAGAARGRPVAVVSVARHNPFGHPSPVVERRLSVSGFRVAETRQEGALLYELRPGGPQRVTAAAWTRGR